MKLSELDIQKKERQNCNQIFEKICNDIFQRKCNFEKQTKSPSQFLNYPFGKDFYESSVIISHISSDKNEKYKRQTKNV